MTRTLLTILGIAAIVSGGIITSGCDEVKPASGEVTITPTSSELKKGNSVTLTATGGYTYDWSLSDENKGTLSYRRGSQSDYTSHFDPEEDIFTQVVTVKSTVDPDYDTSGSTNSVTYASHTAEAYVKHVPSVIVVNITPSSGTVDEIGEQVAFTASGGSSFTWSLDTTGDTYGYIDSTTGPTVIFTYDVEVTSSLTAKLTVVNENNQAYTVDIYLIEPPTTP